MTAINLIEEMLSNIKPVKFIKKEKNGHLTYIFQVKDLLFKFLVINAGEEVVISFASDKMATNDIATTKIAFATMVEIMKDVVDSLHPQKISMAPSTKSRFRLYKDLANTFAKNLNYKVEANDDGLNGHIILIKKWLTPLFLTYLKDNIGL